MSGQIDIVEAVTDELLAHGEFSAGMNNRSNARVAAEVVIAMVRAFDLAQTVQEPGYVTIPQAALDWLFGEKPDADGKWFGEYEDDILPSKTWIKRTYWWRSKFRELCALPSTQDKSP